MSTLAVVIVATIALLSLVALGATVLFLLTQLKKLTEALGEFQEQVAGPLQELNSAAEVTQQELQRVGEAAARLRGAEDSDADS